LRRALLARKPAAVCHSPLAEQIPDCPGGPRSPPARSASAPADPFSQVGNVYTSRLVNRMLSTEKADLMLMLLLTLPSAVSLHYGDEINMRDVRTPTVSGQAALCRSAGDAECAGLLLAQLHAVVGRGRRWCHAKPAATGAPQFGLQIRQLRGALSVHQRCAHVDGCSKQTHALSPFSTLRMVGRLSRVRQSSDAFLGGQLLLAPVSDDFLAYRLSSNYSRIVRLGRTL